MRHRVFPLALAALCAAGPAAAQDAAPPAQKWGFSGIAGGFDLAAARRGLQVFSESCNSCHSLTYVHYRDLAGIGLSAAQIKAMAAKALVPSGTDPQGKPVLKPGTPASVFRQAFATEDAARATFNGALPPDLSLAVNSFAAGPDYIHALLTGYQDPPAGVKLADGMSYNVAFPGHQLAMPQPLADGQIAYTDGTPSTVAQNAHDVVTFLAWAANPETAEREALGGRVILYFGAMAAIAYGLQRRIWSKLR